MRRNKGKMKIRTVVGLTWVGDGKVITQSDSLLGKELEVG